MPHTASMTDTSDTSEESSILLPSELASEAPYISPTLAHLPEAARPQRSTVCQVCPASLWFASEGGLQAYCRIMHSITWSNQEPNALTHCDGQVQSEMERQERMQQ